jgi:GDP-L-fucose synthase
MQETSSILVLGSTGLVGSAIIRALKKAGFSNLLTPKRKELDLLSQAQVQEYFAAHKPEYVIMAAAKVGGIHANNEFRADFIYENLQVNSNVIHAAYVNKATKLQFLGSSCIYPKLCPQPIREEYLLSSALEATNEPYAVAKIAGLKLVESYRRQYGCNFHSVMPTNLYGPGDNFHPTNSHVIPALIQRMDQTVKSKAKEFEIWGTGTPKREFLHVDDLANACVFLMKYQGDLPYWINAGFGSDISIKELAAHIGEIMGFEGRYTFNTHRPDGPPQKLMDSTKLFTLGWRPEIKLVEGLRETIDYYLSSNNIRKV